MFNISNNYQHRAEGFENDMPDFDQGYDDTFENILIGILLVMILLIVHFPV